MENMDSTIIRTSLPAIAQDLNENPLALNLALTAYLVSLAVFIPISGWVADRYGSRSVLTAAIVVIVIGSLLCAISFADVSRQTISEATCLSRHGTTAFPKHRRGDRGVRTPNRKQLAWALHH
jgi:MFS family permease